MANISVIMPIKNGEYCIRKSIESVLRQSMEQIELICVDDGSTDDTSAIIHGFAKRDQRVRMITLPFSCGAAKARKEGILQACGKYMMFLDADDYLEENACEYLYQLMERENTDILHFSSVVENCGAGVARTERMQRFTEPYIGELKEENVFFACFSEKKYRFNLWNKIFRSSLCKTAMSWLDDDYLPKANDLYAYFLIAYFARSYKGLETPAFYHYCFGKGSTGNNRLSLEQFRIYCREKDVADKLTEFVLKQNCDERYAECVKEIEIHFLNECLNNWNEYLAPEESAVGFDMLTEKWSPSELASALALKYHKDRASISKKILGAACLQKKVSSIKTIGIFYFRMAFGGVQRVISLQIPVFLKLGYRVVLFTEEQKGEYEFEVPEETERVILPSSFDIEMDEYFPHGRVLEEKLKEKKVDFLLYHAGSSDVLFYDLLITKMLGISFGIMLHEMFSQRIVSLDPSVAQKPDMFRLADKVLVLSSVEKRYWNTLGVEVEYIPNPIQPVQMARKERSYILWIGRFAAQQKRFEDAVHIMREVVEQLPEARMKMVGSEYTPNARTKLDRLIRKYHLEKNIEVLDYQKDVADLYAHAQVHLMTSAYETFPMTIIESKSYGVPLVTYEMPYVEMLKDGKGYVSVPQEDKKAAANAIILLLNDRERLEQLSKEAEESIKPWVEIDYGSILKKILDKLDTDLNVGCMWEETNRSEEEKDYEIILRTLLFHYTKAVQKYEKLQGQHRKLKLENEKLKGRLEYRIRKKLSSMKYRIINVMKK